MDSAAGKPFYSYSRFLAERYGEQLYRIPLDLGYGCPNRAADGSGGCAFCSESGARAQQTRRVETLEEQVAEGIAFARRRYRARKFMAYIQAFTGTFASASEQRRTYDRILRLHPFAALHVGTRPDCLGPETLEFLCQLREQMDVWVELGVQSVHEATLRRINRGHTWQTSREAILKLNEAGLKTAVHVVVGLPGEGAAQFRQTAETLADLPIDGIKIHNLHVVRGSQLAEDYEKQPFPVYNEYEYAEILIDMLRRLPPGLPIMRMSTDTPEDELIAPRWSMSKGEFLEMTAQQMLLRRVRQGDLYGDAAADTAPPPAAEPVATEDGSITHWNETYKEHYHTPRGACTEALAKYIQPSQLPKRLAAGEGVRLLDVCFGLGYNSLSTCEAAAAAAAGRLEVVGLEMDRGAVGAAGGTVVPPATASLDWSQMLRQLFSRGAAGAEFYRIEMKWGDARHTVTTLGEGELFDLVFLDPFSTQRNSELWTVEFFRDIRAVMHPDGQLFTYCTALPVLSGLMKAGFAVGKTSAALGHRHGTVAALNPERIEQSLSDEELDVIKNSPRGLPYHDPHHTWNNKRILRTRQQAVEALKKSRAPS